MDCEFQTLYFSDDGYVIRCKCCRLYQVAFMCICVTLNETDYQAFSHIVQCRYNECEYALSERSKCIVIQTPAEGICFLLTKAEAKKLIDIVDAADNEAKALSLISMLTENN